MWRWEVYSLGNFLPLLVPIIVISPFIRPSQGTNCPDFISILIRAKSSKLIYPFRLGLCSKLFVSLILLSPQTPHNIEHTTTWLKAMKIMQMKIFIEV